MIVIHQFYLLSFKMSLSLWELQQSMLLHNNELKNEKKNMNKIEDILGVPFLGWCSK